MDASWISPALVGLGIAFQAWREAKKSGAREARQEAHEARLDSHSKQLGELRDVQGSHGEQLAALNTRVFQRPHGGD